MKAELVVGPDAAEVRLIKPDRKIVHEDTAITTRPKTSARQRLRDWGWSRNVPWVQHDDGTFIADNLT